MNMQMVSVAQIAAATGTSISNVWRKAKSDPHFPKAIKLGARTTRWHEHEIRAWITAKSGQEAQR
jgi:predicted DNA-binding transcriptional regulator AlpA